ncbi:MAG: hypothetical protein R3D03_01595 [Geminicoccaceae bacterium]
MTACAVGVNGLSNTALGDAIVTEHVGNVEHLPGKGKMLPKPPIVEIVTSSVPACTPSMHSRKLPQNCAEG